MRIESDPGVEIRNVWLFLTRTEALELLSSLEEWEKEDPPDPDWHTHVTDYHRELTLAVVSQ